jgi:hypothetical protein
VSIALEATGLTPCLRLIEVHLDDVAHLEQIADVHILCSDEAPDLRIGHLITRHVNM